MILQNYILPPRWHIEGRDGICCEGSCTKEKVDDDDMRGPNDTSNWILKGRVLTGEYPGNADDNIHSKILSSLLDSGINIFVCLQLESELKAFRAYQQDVLEMAKQKGIGNIEFINFPMEDGGAAESITELADFIDLLLSKLEQDSNNRIYMHCWAGRGRSGLIASCLLGRLYHVSGLEACRRIQFCYEQRVVGMGESPEYWGQKLQVINYIKLLKQREQEQEQVQEEQNGNNSNS
ncbi:hypothetical protein DFA_05427 [Cavenderia fasciculata]|uniref:Tyrosine specific protein phosphatases domain-containing protein n=1 Tax=Cavenderia fasciculata TaxID=261658 RepID=F4PL73_CACFS|nr:uncharacterized protein DFA_05427 [Cavenderia fasciculata]EGG23295.1 hypothetical protein DFA_05427 [Cavenderia fasciculata]|eukprot:XP_004361146.1 hypothetical protein DFA_05427 [Cavenderia fasciculata]